MVAGKRVFGGIKVDKAQYRDLVFALFLPKAKWVRWMRGQRWDIQPRPVYWCGFCEKPFHSFTAPEHCPYCKRPPGNVGILLDTSKKVSTVCPFLVDEGRLAVLYKLKRELMEGWGCVETAG